MVQDDRITLEEQLAAAAPAVAEAPPAATAPPEEPLPGRLPFRSLTAPQLVSFLREGVSPPSALYVTADESLFLRAWANAAVTITGFARELLPNGEVQTIALSLTTPATRQESSVQRELGEGFLLSVVLWTDTANIKPGQCVVHLGLVLGSGGTATTIATLLQGFLWNFRTLSWPQQLDTIGIPAHGHLRAILLPDPAAGVELTTTVPTNARWRVLVVKADFITSGVAGARTPRLRFILGAAFPLVVEPPVTQGAGIARAYNWGSGLGYSAAPVTTQELIGLPAPLLLPEAAEINTWTNGLDPGDAWSAISLYVEEWIEL